MLKQIVELWIKKRWLKRINKEVERCARLSRSMESQRYIVKDLIREYEKIYKEDLGMRNLK